MIRIRGLKKEFPVKDGVVAALPGLDLDVRSKEFFVLLGPSGSGKSTLLRCVAGIETPESGEIFLGSRLIYSNTERVFVRPEERGLGMVFQSYAVWPHMTVYQNVALPLAHGSKRYSKQAIRDKVMHALTLVRMEALADRPVPYLSGGQQQRVALARALAVEPVVLLMDEPLSNLDARLREEVRAQIHEVTRNVGVTVLYVTHDQVEALALADRIAVMDRGRILQIGAPDALYDRPADSTVAEFFGLMNWVRGIVQDEGKVETEIGTFEIGATGLRGRVRIGLRPRDLQMSTSPSGEPNEFAAQVLDETFLGEHLLLKVRLNADVIFEVKAQKRAREGWTGRTIYCRCESRDVLVFPES